MMRKFYQQEWFGIDFKSFVKLDSGRVADLILGQTFPDEKILSIGCGSGYVEYLLRKEGILPLLNLRWKRQDS